MQLENAAQLGKIIKSHRKKAGLSQIELSKMAGIGKTAVFDAEKGNECMKLKTLLAILAVLNINVELKSPVMEKMVDDYAKG